MKTISKRQFETDAASLSTAVKTGPIAVGDEGGIELVVLSIEDYLQLAGAERKVHTLDDMPEDLLEKLAHIADEPYDAA